MALFNCCFYQADYLKEFKAVQIIFHDSVQNDQIGKVRQVLNNLSAALKIKRLILDYSECAHVCIDINSSTRLDFWKSMVQKGLDSVLLITNEDNHRDPNVQSWISFLKTNHLPINFSVISGRKKLPLFLVRKNSNSRMQSNGTEFFSNTIKH